MVKKSSTTKTAQPQRQNSNTTTTVTMTILSRYSLLQKFAVILTVAAAMILIQSTTTTTTAVVALSSPSNQAKKYYGGAGVGRLVVDDRAPEQWDCHYDTVLVERIQGRPPTESGLFVPQDDLPRLHLCRVISVGPGREEENGRVAPAPDIAVGDVVLAKNPWGIGPKDEETADGRKLSFMRSQDVAAVVTGGLVEEEEEERETEE